MATPRRTCVGCREEADQADLRRFVLREGRVVADPDRSQPGRGAWLHPDPACLELARKRGGFARSFRGAANPDALEATGWPEGGAGR